MFRFLFRVFRRTVSLHLLIPFFGAVIIESGVAYFTGQIKSLEELKNYWMSERVTGLVVVYGVFLLILMIFIKRHADIRIANVAVLPSFLPGATRYFALSATPLGEWFDPGPQVYLATTFGHKLSNAAFRLERVHLFFTRDELRGVHATYLDEYYAKCFDRLHKCFHVPLAFLRPKEIFSILKSLSKEHRRALGCSRLWWRRRIRSLAIALVDLDDGTHRAVLFSKAGAVLDISEIKNPQKMEACRELVRLIKERIYVEGTETLAGDHDFGAYIM